MLVKYLKIVGWMVAHAAALGSINMNVISVFTQNKN